MHDSVPTTKPLLLRGGFMPGAPGREVTVLLNEGVIAALGTPSGVTDDLPPGTDTIDLEGATILPGLGDAHVHMTATGFLATAVDATGAHDLGELLGRVEEAARATPPGELVLALRVDPHRMRESRPPSRAELDAAAPDRAVYLRHVTGHASYANTAAMSRLGLHPGATGVEVDEDGVPTGRLTGPATQTATHRAYAAYSHQIGYETALRKAATKAARSGCTMVHALDDLDAIRTLLAIEDDLPVRTVAYPQTFDLDAVRALGLRRIGGCHACALDGDVDVHTAALLEPYLDDASCYGSLYHNDDTLLAFVLSAHQAGMQLAFHAVGDRAVEQVLRTYEAANAAEPRENARHRIEHAELISDLQIARARALGSVLSVQPAFNHVWPHETYLGSLGPDRAERVDPLARLLHGGLAVAGGSDSTVTELRPLLGVHAAVNHSREGERLSVQEALDAFTVGVAHAAHQEKRRGRTVVGFDADLTIVDGDPLGVAPSELVNISVRATIVRGDVVHQV